MKRNEANSGFTIVELLIVIVVIAILAAITIVAYNGIQDRARSSAAASSSSQAAKKVKVWQVDNELTSPSCAQFYTMITNLTGSLCTFDFKDTNYQYTAGTAGAFCVTTTVVNKSYKVSDSTTPTSGGCAGHGVDGVSPITNLATNPSFETNTTSHTPSRGTFALDSTKSLYGSKSVLFTCDGTVGTPYIYTTIQTGDISGQTVNVSIQGQRGTTAASLSVRIYFRDSTNTYLAPVTGVEGTAVALNSGSWVRATASGTAPTGTTNIQTYAILNPGTFAAGTLFWYDGMMVNLGSSPANYADGSSANWAWTGTAHASTSTGPPL